MVTLSDQKAILFYLGLFPVFVNMQQLTVLDSMVMVLMAATAIAGSKLAYAYFSNRMRIRFSTSTVFRFLYYIAGTLLLAAGLFLLLSALGSFFNKVTE